TRGLREEGSALDYKRGRHEIGMAHEGADGEAAHGIRSDAVEARHAIQVDENGGAEEAQVEHGYEALPAREDLDVRVATAQELHGVRERRRPHVWKRSRFHERSRRTPGGEKLVIPSRARISQLSRIDEPVSLTRKAARIDDDHRRV